MASLENNNSEIINSRSVKLSIGAILFSVTSFAVSTTAVPSLITTIARDLNVDFALLGYLVMIQFSFFFLVAFLGGWVGERFNITPRFFVASGMLISAATLMSGAFINSFSLFLVWAIPLGVGGGLVEAFASVMVSDYEKSGSSKLLNLSQLFYCVGAIAAPGVVSLILYMGKSWRTIFVIFSIFVLFVYLVFITLTQKRSPQACSQESQSETKTLSLGKDIFFYLLAFVLISYVTVESVFACWTAAFFESKFHSTPRIAAIALSIFWIGVIAGRAVASIVPHKHSLWPSMFTGIIIFLGATSFACFVETKPAMFVIIFLCGLGAGPLWPVTVAISRDARNSARFTSSIIGIGAIGVVIGVALGGAILKRLGTSQLFPILAAGVAILCIATVLASIKYKQEKRFPGSAEPQLRKESE